MKKNYIARRRGTSVAAAALSFALVAPFAQSVAVAQETPAAVADQTAGASSAADQSETIDADAIASGRVTKAANLTDAQGVGKGLISGHVYLTGPKGNPGSTIDNGNIPLDGVTVYAQFQDKDGSYSPIFSAKTHTLPNVVGGNGGKGTFAFGTEDKGITWTDKLGVEHTWAARTDQKHRIWVEPYTNDRGNKVVMFRQANGFVPGSFNGLVEGPLGSFAAADGNIQLTAAFYQEVPPNHETSWMAAKGDKLVEDPEGPIDAPATQLNESNVLSGRVWLETGGPDKGIVATGPAMNSIDEPADGYTVYASTLTKDGAAANQKLHEQFKDDPNKLADATKKMLEDNPEYILKTVYGKTDPDGYYSLRFGELTDANQTNEDSLNKDNVFVWVENEDGVVQNGYTGFHTPVFQKYNDGGNFRASAIPARNRTVTSRVEDQGKPRYGKQVNSIYNVNYALMPYTPVSIVADYNATDKPAAPGTTVTPEFSGDLSTLPSQVEWRDQQGKVLKTCELDQSKGIKAQVAACTFDIPEDAEKGDYFNVVLVSGGNDVSAWTVLVTKDSDEYTPAYEDKFVVPGEETKSTPIFTKVDEEGNPTEEKVEAPEGSKFAIPGDFKAPEGYEVAIDENTGEITVTFPDKSKLNADTVEEFDVPVTVTYPDGSTDKEVKAKFKLDTDGDGKPDNEDTDDDGDGIPDDQEKEDGTNPKAPNQNLDFEPEYEDGSGKPGEDVTVPAPTFTDKDGKETTAPDGTKFTPGEGAPDGVTVDENTGEITVPVPEDAKPGDKITVPVDVTYPDGTKDTVDVTVTVDEPDVPAPAEKDNEKYQPGYEDGSGKPGEDVTVPAPTFTDKDGKETTAPDGTKFTPGEGAPDGVTVDENTGEITVPVPEDAKPGDKITVPVDVTYPDGTKDTVDVTVTVDEPDVPAPAEKDNEKYQPGYEDGSGKPGEDVTVPAPTFTDKDGKETTAPDGTKFTPGEGAPDGVTVDENTGEITVKVPQDAKPGDKITVPVDVTYPDGTKDTVDVTVTVDEPDVPAPAEKDNEKYQPGYEDGSGKPGEDVTVPAPTFTDKDGKETTAPDGTKFTPGEGAPDGVTVDENTGEITVPVPEDAKPGDKITVPVDVTYPDGTKDTVDVTVTVDEPDVPAPAEKDNEKYQPGYEDGSGKPGEDVTVPAPTFTDKDGKETTAPDGTKFTPGEGAPDGVTVDENTGEITVKVPQDAKPGDKITVPVDVTYPDGTKDTVDVTVTVDEPAKTPDWNDETTTPGEPVEIEKDPNSGDFTPGSTVEVTDGPGTAEIDDNGKITVTPSDEAKPGDKIVVDVKDPEGKVIDTVTVTVTDPDATQAETFDPNYEELTQVTVDGDKATNNPFGGEDAPLKNIDSKASDGSQDWEFQMQENGVIVATAPTMAEVGEAVGEQLPTIDKSWEKFVETFTPYARPTVTVDFTYEDDSKDEGVDANFDLLGKDDKSLLDPNGDFDGDGHTNKDEIEKGTNPADKDSKPSEGDDVKDTTPPTVNPIKPGDKTISGTGDRPNEDIIVELPGGKKVETKTDKDGKWTIDVPAGVELKPGDKVIVSDGAGNKTPAQVGIDTGKCVATSLGFGLPLLALIPLGLASQMEIPGLSNVVADANAQLQAANTRIQQQLGLFNPEIAAQVDAANRQLAQFGTDIGTVAGGLALIAAGILAGTLIYDNCSPNGGGSSVKDLELKGSSGKTYAGSSKKEDKAGEKAADKK
ncbi:YPDG domain-containing protein [Corynebacterium sp. CQ3829_602738]